MRTPEDRRRLAERTLRQFPNRVPIVLLKSPRCRTPKGKPEDYLVVPDDWTVGKLVAALRKRITLNQAEGRHVRPAVRGQPFCPLSSRLTRLPGAGTGWRVGRRYMPGLYLYVNGVLPTTSAQISAVYQEHKADDLLLYITYDTESTYG